MNRVSITTRQWTKLLLLNLFIVSLAGLWLRSTSVVTIVPVNYEYLLHAHSHFALAGWGFLALFVALKEVFIIKQIKYYEYIFLSGLIAAYGMLVSFPFKGYAVVSISFSTLFILISYWFGWRFYKDTKGQFKNSVSIRLAYAALFFLIISSVGPFAMGPIMASGKSGSPIYHNAIYYYLHFQYNGWLIFGLFALFFRWLERQNIPYKKKAAKWFYRLFFWSAFPTCLLSFLWAGPAAIVFWIGGIGALIQLLSVIPLAVSLRHCRTVIKHSLQPVVQFSSAIVLFCFLLKLMMQVLSAIPVIVRWTTAIRTIVIGYLHLVFLGIFTLFMFSWFIQKKVINRNKLTFTGLVYFLAGLFMTEALLFLQSALNIYSQYIPHFNSWMFYTTIFLPLGIGCLFLGNLLYKHYPVKTKDLVNSFIF